MGIVQKFRLQKTSTNLRWSMNKSGMNSVLADIIETGRTKTASGDGELPIHSAISFSQGAFLQKLVRELDPTVTLEVGLAYGISALFICGALRIRADTLHIAIDPNQHGGMWGDNWDGIGMANLRRSGYDHFVRLIEEPSYRALPVLERSGQHIDFAFIDGWHTFDFTLVDFFFIDRILKIGGVVAFDDANWPAVRKVCRFVSENLDYSVLAADGTDPKSSRKRRFAEKILRREPFIRLLRPEVARPDIDLGLQGRCIAFRKNSADSRRWDHFADF